MPQPTAGGPPSPVHIFQTLRAFEQTDALKTAIELDLFTAIGEGVSTAGALAKHCQASERGLRILCDYLVIHGFLLKDGTNYGLTPEAAVFLDRRSPACIASVAGFLAHPLMRERLATLTDAVRKGGTTAKHDSLAPDDPIWVEFAKSMASMQAFNAEAMAKRLVQGNNGKLKVLDIAAGHGLFGIAIGQHHPQAEIVAVDWSNVLEVARENAGRANLDGRHRLLPGSAFEVDYGTGYDLALVTNFLHHFDVPTNESLLRKVHGALKPGGRVAVLEFVPNEDRITPPAAAQFALTMLAGTPSGDAYTFAELDGMLRKAGFSRSEIHELAPTPQSLVVAYA